MRLGDPRLRGDDKSQERGGFLPHPKKQTQTSKHSREPQATRMNESS